MRERRLIEKSILDADKIIKYLNQGFTTSKKTKFFFNFALKMAEDSDGITAFIDLQSACRLVENYLNTLKTYDMSDDSDWVKQTKKMELRAKLSQDLEKCGPIEKCLNNDKVYPVTIAG